MFVNRIVVFGLLAGCLLIQGCRQSDDTYVAGLPDVVDFNFHIKPILSDRCFSCHGPDAATREADLRLDTPEGAFAVLSDGSHAIKAFKPHRSTLYQRISSQDPDIVMPPPDSKLRLQEAEVALIKKWIDQGAVWKQHWSFTSPTQTTSARPGTVLSIDHFIEKKLEESGLSLQNSADPYTLLRRVYLDLTGLPPDVDEIDAFISDSSVEAYEQVIDELLSRPAFGERFAAEWMDAARYADTHGYLDDTHREAWHWRDWVIQAFNNNLPYDDFIKWQIAGDLLPNATRQQRLASGFNRLHRQNQEGGVLPEEYRVEAVADRVHTTATAFLGLTMECARCHDHKYDPVTQVQFYEMAAFFNNTNEIGRAPIGYESGPTMLLTDEAADQKIEDLTSHISALEAAVAAEVTAATDAQATSYLSWLPADRSLPMDRYLNKGLIGHFDFDDHMPDGFKNKAAPHSFVGTKDWAEELHVEGVMGKAVLFDEENAVFMGRDLASFERTDPFSFALWVHLPDSMEDASIFDNADHKWHAYRGYELRIKDGRLLFRIAHKYPQNSLQVESTKTLPVDKWTHVAVSYDGSSKAAGMRLFVDGQHLDHIVVHDQLYKSILHDSNNAMVVMPYLGLKIGWRMNDPTLLGGKIDEMRIYDRVLAQMEVAHLAKQLDMQAAADHWFKELYTLHYVRPAKQDSLQQKREALNKILTPIPEAMVMGDQKQPRSTFVLSRGMYDQPLEEVFPSMPAFLLPFDERFSKDRLGLADWIVHPENPLTARVAVNRFWQLIFGTGLVDSPEDFGNQGSLPTHPELLDWLAQEFRAGGWDVKKLIKMMVMSDVYRQSSKASEEATRIDPENRLLSRGVSRRLPAEMIRDQALAASGLLTDQVGGTSIKPYQPAGLWAELAFQQWAQYEPDTDENLYRRSMYIYWKQNTPHPYMTTFDVGDRGACAMQRIPTSSPTQALMLLNYPQFIEAARALAVLAISKHDALDDQLRFVYKSLLLEEPTSEHIALMDKLFQEEKTRYSKDEQALNAYLSVGEYRASITEAPVHLAALSVVGHSLMNTVNFYMKR